MTSSSRYSYYAACRWARFDRGLEGVIRGVTSTGLAQFSPVQVVSDGAHQTFAHPSIAAHPGPEPRQFDYAVGFTRPSDRRVAIELLKMTSYGTHQTVLGPWYWQGWESWQGPSVAVDTEGRFALAFRYEKNNPNPNNPNELKRNSMIRLLVSNPDHSVVYNVEPATCFPLGVCRTINTPAIAYNAQSRRWILAFVEAAQDQSNIGYMNSVTLLVSDDQTGLYWSKAPFRTGYHTSYIPPAITCLDPSSQPYCMLAFATWDNSTNGWMARIYQYGIRIGGCSDPSGLCALSGTYFQFGRSGFGRIGLASGPPGWVMSRIDTPAAAHDNLTWTFKPYTAGIGGTSWGSDQNVTSLLSEKGFSIACARFGAETRCRLVWSYE